MGAEACNHRIFCLTGATAVGKTEAALRWAEANSAEIVNCDSLLFYRGMDIGTAKPSLRERARVTHHMIDLCEASEPRDVGRYVEEVEGVIAGLWAEGKRALVVGGSGFYLKAFFEPVVDGVVISPEVSELARELMACGLDTAVQRLRELNPEGLGTLDIRNPRRVAKALERCLQTGQGLRERERAFRKQTNLLVRAPKSLCVLDRDPAQLERRIGQRVSAMLEAGLVEEVRALAARGFQRNPSACNAIGYRETLACLRGEADWEGLGERIALNTRRLAKKQRTWFRGQLPGDARWIQLAGLQEAEPEALFP